MLKTVMLLLPALIPSWRFFDIIAPSPRIEFAWLKTPSASTREWREFRPRPAQLTLRGILGRLVWNPLWNETLFLVSCAERIMEGQIEHSVREIALRLQAELVRCAINCERGPYWQFRLIFVERQGEALQRRVQFTSPLYCVRIVSHEPG